MSYQTIIVVGRLGKDPEMRYTPSGQAVASFSLATDRQYTGQDGTVVKETTWFRVSVWGKQAETVNQYLSKGKMVLVEGRLQADAKRVAPASISARTAPLVRLLRFQPIPCASSRRGVKAVVAVELVAPDHSPSPQPRAKTFPSNDREKYPRRRTTAGGNA